MSFTSIPSGQIGAGQPVTQDLLAEVKGNDDDHESRIATLESTTASRAPIAFEFLGYPDAGILATTGSLMDTKVNGLMSYRVPANITVLAVRLFVGTAGASGSLTCDVQYKRGAGSWASILSSPASIASSAGNLSTAAGTLAVSSLQTGDLLRLRVSSIQPGMQDFAVYVEIQGA